jgi:hypothetical protein
MGVFETLIIDSDDSSEQEAHGKREGQSKSQQTKTKPQNKTAKKTEPELLTPREQEQEIDRFLLTSSADHVQTTSSKKTQRGTTATQLQGSTAGQEQKSQEQEQNTTNSSKKKLVHHNFTEELVHHEKTRNPADVVKSGLRKAAEICAVDAAVREELRNAREKEERSSRDPYTCGEHLINIRTPDVVTTEFGGAQLVVRCSGRTLELFAVVSCSSSSGRHAEETLKPLSIIFPQTPSYPTLKKPKPRYQWVF